MDTRLVCRLNGMDPLKLILEVDKQHLTITALSSRNDCLNGIYEFTVECFSALRDMMPYVAKLACVQIQFAQEKLVFRGILNQIKQQPYSKELFHYTFLLLSPLSVLKNNMQSRHFVKKSLKMILHEVLQSNKKFIWPYQIASCVPDVEIDYVLQYNESDWDFWSRLCFQYGVNFYFASQPEEKLWIFSKRKYGEQISLQYIEDAHLLPNESHISELKSHFQLLPKHVIVGGEDNQIQWQEEILIAKTNNPCHQLSNIIEIDSKQYQILCIDRGANQTLTSNDCLSQLTLIPIEKTYRQPSQETEIISKNFWQESIGYQAMFSQGIQPHKTNNDLFAARIANDARYPCPNEYGHYPVIFTFQQDNDAIYIPKLRVFSPPKTEAGIDFELTPGTTVIVGHIAEELNRPIILGAYFSKQNPSPVTQKNHTQNILATPKQLEFLTDDLKNNEKIVLKSQDNQICLASSNPNLSMRSKKPIKIKSHGDLMIDVGCEWRVIAKSIFINTAFRHNIFSQESMTISSAQSLYYHANENLYLTAEKNHLVQSKGWECFTENVFWDAHKIQMKSYKNDITIESFSIEFIVEKNRPIYFIAGNSALSIQDTLVLKANKTLSIQANEFICEGSLHLN